MRNLTSDEVDSVTGGYNGTTTGTRIEGAQYLGNGGTGTRDQIASVLGNGLPPQPTFPEAPRDPDGPPIEAEPDDDTSILR